MISALITLAAAALLVVIDQGIKFWATVNLAPVGSMPLIPGVVDLRYWPGNIEQLAEEYDQILILYNFQSFYKDVGIRKLNINLNQ